MLLRVITPISRLLKWLKMCRLFLGASSPQNLGRCLAGGIGRCLPAFGGGGGGFLA